MALLQSLLGNNAAFSLSHDFRVAGILLDSQENLDNYEDSRQTLSNTIRQISQKKSAYNEVLEEQKARTADLRRQEEKLDAAIARIRSDRNVAEARLQELKVRERERLRKTRSATGGDSPPQAEEKPRDVVNTPRDSSDKPRVGGDKPREGGGDRSRDGGDEPRDGGHKPRDDRDTLQDNAGNPRGEGDTLRETENEVAQEDIFVQPLEHVSRATYLRLYQKAARDYGFARDWYILAAVGKVESNHGESMGTSSAGAMGPMQFLPSTWESSGVDGNGDGKANIMDPRDAIPAAAGYLRDGGAPDDWYAALYSYNHADWYVKEVLAVAETYRKAAKDDRVGPYV
ncbi:MAG: lytic murein transglycosylase [Rubrobacter sp.]|nr:lytic murein transglycosylase [Rubrobacter sp.]